MATTTSLENVSSQREPSREERHMSWSQSNLLMGPKTGCCSCPCLPNSHWRRSESKGAALVIFLGFSGLCIIHLFIMRSYQADVPHGINIGPIAMLIPSLLLYPVYCWLADAHFGRHKMVKWGLWLSLVALGALCLVPALVGPSHEGVHMVLYVLVALSLGCFQANILQFGMDQLSDASSDKITFFIRWYTWAWFLGEIVVYLSQFCLCADYEAVALLFFPSLVTCAIVLEISLGHWLVKEKTSRNPLTLIFNVLRYAAKNKYPRLRNAFSYWDDRQYSRIDLAKTRFGGPYTTEQVEDVKTFFRVVSIVAAGAVFIGLFVPVYPVFTKIASHLQDFPHSNCMYSSQYINRCFLQTAITTSGGILIVIGLPLFELVLYPKLKKHLRVSMLKKLVTGFVLLFLSLLSCAAVEFTAQYKFHESHKNVTVACPMSQTDSPHTYDFPVGYKWMAISFALMDLAQFMLLTATVEFVCAQSPFSLKGYVIGIMFSLVGLFLIAGYALMFPVQLLAEKKLSDRHGCMFWYLVISSGILIAILVAFSLIAKCYKRRSRSEDNNEQ